MHDMFVYVTARFSVGGYSNHHMFPPQSNNAKQENPCKCVLLGEKKIG